VRRLATLAVLAASFAVASAQEPPASPAPSPSPSALPSPSVLPSGAVPSTTPVPLPEGSGQGYPGASTPAASAEPTVPPTPPPITVSPESAQVAVGSTGRITVGSALSPLTVTAGDATLIDVSVDQNSQSVFVTGKAPGTTSVTIADARGLSRTIAVRTAFYAGAVPARVDLQITGDPAAADYVRDQVVRAVTRAAQLRKGAQAVLGVDDVPFNGTLPQDRVASFDVPVLLQGSDYFEVTGSTRVNVTNVAVPRISPDSLMVSDYPERLEENGVLFSADLQVETPSRFLYFHYNPPGQPDRRIVLRAENASSEPTIVQFISGRGGPLPNEMEAGHTSTKSFLVNVVQNQGRLITIPANSSLNIAEQDLPAGNVVCNLLQLRVLSGSKVHLTLFAQNFLDDPNIALANVDLLEATHKHARGIYAIPEFYYATQWSVTGDYLELPIGQIPLPNRLKGEALAGDYGVLQSFTVDVQNPTSSPQTVALYENPRGGRATATYLIDGTLVQSHQVTAYSRYKVRQYVIPARGFVRVTIVTMPEAGSSYPLKLIFAPDDGSVAPYAPGSPIY
jgi:Pilus formation protein N terminal region